MAGIIKEWAGYKVCFNLIVAYSSFTEYSTFDRHSMIEMDQFTLKLSGETKQNIERRSQESTATMKGIGMTIERYEGKGCTSFIRNDTDYSFMKKMKERQLSVNSTWCGFPHNLLLPRWSDGLNGRKISIFSKIKKEEIF